MHVIDSLPKDELAAIAESLVNSAKSGSSRPGQCR
jgi:hypothetical protein